MSSFCSCLGTWQSLQAPFCWGPIDSPGKPYDSALKCGPGLVHGKNIWILFPNKRWESTSPTVSTTGFDFPTIPNPGYLSDGSQTSAYYFQLPGTPIEPQFSMSSVHFYRVTCSSSSLGEPRATSWFSWTLGSFAFMGPFSTKTLTTVFYDSFGIRMNVIQSGLFLFFYWF